jgi:hypothetical protein
VAEQQQRLFIRRRLEPRVDALPLRIVADQPRGDAFFDEQVAQKHRPRGLVARRIGGVDFQIGDERLLGLPVERVLRRAARAAAVEGCEYE